MQLASLRVTVDGPILRDAAGRRLLLRGVNAGGSAKLPPYAPFEFEDDYEGAMQRYLDRWQGWGLSLVRLPFSWEALEPERGRYDEGYLGRYEALARACGERGLRVIVDFHQDVFARPYAGDGFPLWACPAPVPPPAAMNRHWFLGYTSDDRVKLAFDRFWRNEDGLRDAFAAMWRHMAARLWQLDNVIGFEIINEPGWGSADLATWAEKVLTPFYGEMVAVVREAAPGAPIFIDCTGADSLRGVTELERPAGDGLVFAPHFYAPEVIFQGSWEGDARALDPVENWAALGARWNVPVLLGEFGIDPRARGADRYVRLQYDWLDRLLLHGTLWECSTSPRDWNDEAMSILAPDGSEHATVAELVRPYPLAVAGTLDTWTFDADTNRGELRFQADAGGTSELVVPRRRYPRPPRATLEGISGEITHADDRLLVHAHGAGAAKVAVSP
jgi:endoglycosylceramidase